MSRAIRTRSHDLLRVVAVDDPRMAPDGTRVAWLETRIDPERDTTVTALRIGPADAAGPPRTLLERTGLRRPRWSPDGRELAFLVPADDGAGAQVASVEVKGGRTQRWASAGGPVLDLAWSPGGDGLAIVARLPAPDAPDDPPPGVIRATRLKWKIDGAGLVGDRWTQLLWLPRDGGPGVPLVRGPFDVDAPAWSPDGTTLAFLGMVDPEGAGAASRRRDLWLLDTRAGSDAHPRRLASFADVRIAELSWSPDGGHLALAAHDAEGIGHYGAQRLVTVNVRSGSRRTVTRPDDGTLGNAAYTDVGGYGGDCGPRWHGRGGSMVATISRAGSVRLCRIDPTGRIEPLTPDDRVVAAWSQDRAGRRAALLCWDRHGPGEVEIVDLAEKASGPAAPRRLSHAGSALTTAMPAVTPRALEVPADPERHAPALDAWLLHPPDSVPGPSRSVPLIVYCGGGPGGMRSDNYVFEFQLFAASGYAVLWMNARGCQGYGDPFCTAILGDWGGADWEDEQRALDAALLAVPELDPDRVAIAGGSYGGYQVNWAIGRSDRFRAAVSDRSVSNRVSAFGTSDIGFQRTFEYDGATPWEDPGAYLAQTPLQGLAGVRTPTLVLHSAEDHRCPVEQGEQLYFALHAQGAPTELVRFPNESHGLSRGGRPWHRVARLDAYLDWFDRWLR